jgi:hypothetical protein
LHVAAAANLSNVLPDLSAAFGRQTKIVPSLGATGAPFDVFLSADVEHVGVAKPELAPSIAIAKQFADTGNAEAASTASEILKRSGRIQP